ncbi:SPOR domain-containing protein [Sphingomonas sp. LB2R24]|uniref:SPOR domain-containing protein n=1 Tax=Sphingomonas TaxID=13687 RepID=UPI00104F240C|nr:MULTISPECIES: SPOR domain-containing protein [Sphingomonas]TCP98628.1 sporulation related protein [Sphingomonas sp. PP-F2F-A104-K0414]TCQ04423.1 sporulation related protein [Sphingomonas sp. PP-CC-3A-396]
MAEDMDLREEDRLPWLETVEPDEQDTVGIGRVIALVVLGLAVLAAIIFGIYKLQQRAPTGDGQMIAAQEGDYKVKPDDAGGLKVKGEGDSAIATSAGKSGNGAIDLRGVPEAPVDGKRAVATKTSDVAGRNAVAQVPASGGRLVAATPLAPSKPNGAGTASGGSLVQLGAYPSEAVANAAWTTFSKRFAYIGALGKSVQPVATGGRTLYRLRVNAGSANQAADICGRLRVAGETCFVAS